MFEKVLLLVVIEVDVKRGLLNIEVSTGAGAGSAMEVCEEGHESGRYPRTLTTVRPDWFEPISLASRPHQVGTEVIAQIESQHPRLRSCSDHVSDINQQPRGWDGPRFAAKIMRTEKGLHRVGKACVFCGKTGSITGEHVFSAWLRDYLVTAGVPAFSRASRSSGDAEQSWTMRTLDLEVKDVCMTCNNGWMSEIEAHSKPVLQDLVLGREHVLSPGAQRAVAKWAFKVAVMLEFANPAYRAVTSCALSRVLSD